MPGDPLHYTHLLITVEDVVLLLQVLLEVAIVVVQLLIEEAFCPPLRLCRAALTGPFQGDLTLVERFDIEHFPDFSAK